MLQFRDIFYYLGPMNSIEPEIVPATLDDLPMLNVISVASKRHWGYPDEWIDNWKDDLTITENFLSENQIFKLKITGKIIGFCAISEDEIQYEVEHLWVLPDYIGKGYGKLLLKESLHKAVVKNKPVIVIADPNAEPFYASQGFKTFEKMESFPKGRFLPIMRSTFNMP